MKNTKKIALITHLGISGDCDLNIPERTTFKLNPYRLESGVVVGEFLVTPEQLEEIKKTKHWAKTYIQLRDNHPGGNTDSAQSNQVNVGTVINPLGFSQNQQQIVNNALLVKPALREILVDNVLDACMKVIDADNLPPKKDKAPAKPKAKATGGKGKDKAPAKGNPPAVVPTSEEILAMDEAKLKEAFNAQGFGDEYDPDEDLTTNKNALMDLLAEPN